MVPRKPSGDHIMAPIDTAVIHGQGPAASNDVKKAAQRKYVQSGKFQASIGAKGPRGAMGDGGLRSLGCWIFIQFQACFLGNFFRSMFSSKKDVSGSRKNMSHFR